MDNCQLDDKRMSVIEHLDELRKRLIACIITIIITSSAAYAFIKPIMKFITQPVGKPLVFITPYEAFLAYFMTALFCGIFLASPVILFHVWRFVSAGLLKRERRYILLYLPFSFLLFIFGAAFAFTIVLPLAMKFLLGFAIDNLQPMLSISKYISFAGMLVLSFGLIFQMPVVILLLTELGIVTPGSLRKQRKYAILIIFIVSAVLTPSPDCVSQLLMAIPLLILFEMTIWLSVFRNYRKKKQFRGCKKEHESHECPNITNE